MSELHRSDSTALAKWLSQAPVRMDCFWVTTAHLLCTTVDDIARRLEMPVPKPGGTGMPTGLLEPSLTKLGLAFNVWLVQNGGSSTGAVRNGKMAKVERKLGTSPKAPRVVGVAYQRPDGSGHVVVCRNPGRPYSRFQDYQASSKGSDVSKDVSKSKIVAYFAVDTAASRGKLVQEHKKEIEMMDVDEEKQHPGDDPMDWE